MEATADEGRPPSPKDVAQPGARIGGRPGCWALDRHFRQYGPHRPPHVWTRFGATTASGEGALSPAPFGASASVASAFLGSKSYRADLQHTAPVTSGHQVR